MAKNSNIIITCKFSGKYGSFWCPDRSSVLELKKITKNLVRMSHCPVEYWTWYLLRTKHVSNCVFTQNFVIHIANAALLSAAMNTQWTVQSYKLQYLSQLKHCKIPFLRDVTLCLSASSYRRFEGSGIHLLLDPEDDVTAILSSRCRDGDQILT